MINVGRPKTNNDEDLDKKVKVVLSIDLLKNRKLKSMAALEGIPTTILISRIIDKFLDSLENKKD